jgi:hypothetical protein
MECDVDFEEGPKSLSNSRTESTQSEIINESRKKSKVKIKEVDNNAGAITTNL